VPTLLADFLTRAAVAPSAPAAAAASSARAPRRQNAGSESQRSRLRSRLRIGVKWRARLSPVSFVPHNWPRRHSERRETWSEWQDLNLRPPRPERGALPGCATAISLVRLIHANSDKVVPPSASNRRVCAGEQPGDLLLALAEREPEVLAVEFKRFERIEADRSDLAENIRTPTAFSTWGAFSLRPSPAADP
jgi:hypothetical protein